MMDVFVNHLLLQMESKSFRLSCIRFCAATTRKCISRWMESAAWWDTGGPTLSIRFWPFIPSLEAVVFLLEMISSRQQKPTESSGRSNGSPSGSNGFHLQKAEAKSIGRGVDGPAEAKKSTHSGLVFVKNLIVFGHGDAEDDGRYILEAVDPFLPLGTLSTDVEQSVVIKRGLCP